MNMTTQIKLCTLSTSVSLLLNLLPLKLQFNLITDRSSELHLTMFTPQRAARSCITHFRRQFSSDISAKKAAAPSSATLLQNQHVSDSTPNKKSAAFLKYGLLGTVVGAGAAAGYITYEYTIEDVAENTKAFRASANFNIRKDASPFEKFQALFYSAPLAVPSKAIELYLDLRRAVEAHIREYTEPSSEKLLPDLRPMEKHIFTLVLDLNETLIHSDWKRDRGWQTFKRPGVDAFLEQLAQFYEIVVYSDQQNMYVDPIIERLDQKGSIRYKLSRDSTKYQNGKHYRDLSKLNRDPSRILYVSGHALESSLQPENCVQIKPWKLEAEDTTLLDLIPFLEFVARHKPADIRPVLASYQGHDIATEFLQRSKEHQRRILDQRQQGRLRLH